MIAAIAVRRWFDRHTRAVVIGQAVSFDHIALADYVNHSDKVVRYQRIRPMQGVIVGLGTLYEGSRNATCGGSWGEDYEPASFSVSRAVKLWQVRTGWRNKVIHVADPHITLTEPFTLPAQSGRPRWIVTEVSDADESLTASCL